VLVPTQCRHFLLFHSTGLGRGAHGDVPELPSPFPSSSLVKNVAWFWAVTLESWGYGVLKRTCLIGADRGIPLRSPKNYATSCNIRNSASAGPQPGFRAIQTTARKEEGLAISGLHSPRQFPGLGKDCRIVSQHVPRPASTPTRGSDFWFSELVQSRENKRSRFMS
jgi:hypothetical protein